MKLPPTLSLTIKYTILSTACGLALTGCGSLHGPSIESTAPRVVGQAVDAASGAPIRNARVGRTLYSKLGASGEPRKGGEELMYLQSFVRTDASGNFEIRSQRVALLFHFGDLPLNLRLAIQAGGYQSWMTNYPFAALGTNDAKSRPRIDAGTIPMEPKSTTKRLP